jgi:hypothetical protein
MSPYYNLSGASGVASYEITPSSIVVRFRTGGTYEYQASNVGMSNFQSMIACARAGRGLNTLINQNPTIKYGYRRAN